MFALLGIALATGLLSGFLMHGRTSNLKEIRVRFAPLLFASLIVGMLPLFLSLARTPRIELQMVSMLGVLTFLAIAIRSTHGGVRVGFGIVLAGWFLNFVPMAANGGMPLSLWAWSHSGQRGAPTPGSGGFFKIIEAKPGTLFRFLGDAIPIRPVSQVVSIGDILLMLGIIAIIAYGMRPATEAEPASPAAVVA